VTLEKYKNLSTKSPQEAAEIVGVVEKRNYLAHTIRDKLKNPEILENTVRSDEEEIYAWKFAYHLIDKKSAEHKDDMHRGKFVYSHGELKQSLISILKDRKPEICDAVINSLSA
jgi:phage terminase large subunit-like protein